MEPKELLTLAEWHESQMVLYEAHFVSAGLEGAEKRDEITTKAKFHRVAAKMLRKAYEKLTALSARS